MWKYMREHEAWVRGRLSGAMTPVELEETVHVHDRMISRMQHERLIHLMVTLAIALFALLSVGFAVVTQLLFAFLLSLLLLGLVSAYLVHYFRLENGVQRWYRLADDLADRCVTHPDT